MKLWDSLPEHQNCKIVEKHLWKIYIWKVSWVDILEAFTRYVSDTAIKT